MAGTLYPFDVTSNLSSATIATGGSDAPASGTSEVFTVTNAINVPSISASVTQFRFVDAAQASNPSEAEVMTCTAVNGASWSIIRGTENIGGNSTTPVAHASNWVAIIVTTEGTLANILQNQMLSVNAASVGASVIIPAPNAAPNYYNANFFTLTEGGSTLQLPTAYVGLDTLVSVYQGATGGYAYSFTDAGGDTLAAQSYGLLANQVDFYTVFSLDGSNLNVRYDGTRVVPSTAAPISPVGSAIIAASGTSSATWTQTVQPTAVGDILVVSVASFNTKTLSSVSGGGVTTWSTPVNASQGIYQTALAWGIVTTAGSATLTLNWSAATSGGVATTQEFRTSAGTFSADGSASTATSNATTLTLPSKTPAGNNELYIAGFYCAQGTPTVTSGYSLSQGVTNAGLAWNANVSSAGGAQAPVLTVTTGDNQGVAILLKA